MNRRGMTLVEMLVAVTATLILMAAVAQVFEVFGKAITGSRAVLELDGQLRNVAWRLRTDLAGATVDLLPPRSLDAGDGYFEIIEGPARDADSVAGQPIGPADHDDVLLFTTRARETPFLGRFKPEVSVDSGASQATQSRFIESSFAEVAWFARETPGTSNPITYTLYRRQMLIIGYLGSGPFGAPVTATTYSNIGGAGRGHETVPWSYAGSSWAAFYRQPYDISVRLQGSRVFLNSLADLARREARFLHNPVGTVPTASTDTVFPYPFVAHQAASSPDGLIFEAGDWRGGEDVVLTNVLAFDVRVFDPAAPVVQVGNTAVVPGDPGFTGSADASGAYVDLGNGVTANSLFSGTDIAPRFARFGEPQSRLVGSATTPRVYDTWSLHYEANGIDEDGDGVVDQATEGLDPQAFETRPPYPYPLRGIEVRIRCYEPSSRQVRQVTVRHTFVPH